MNISSWELKIRSAATSIIIHTGKKKKKNVRMYFIVELSIKYKCL